MYKIAIVTSTIYSKDGIGKTAGGGYVVTSELIDALQKIENVELCVIANRLASKPDYSYVIIDEPIHKNYINKADEYIRQNKFDFVITANVEWIYQNNLLQAHSFIHKCRKNSFPLNLIKQFLSRNKIKRERRLFDKKDENSKFIAMSEIIKKDYSSNFGINPDNIKVVYPGCRENIQEYKPVEKKELITFGMVANSSINKGGHLFLLAMGVCKCLGAKFNIKIIAPKYEKDILMKLIVSVFGLSKNIEVLDKQSDMSDFYSGIDVIVLPSFNEAFGLVVIEAASWGKPSIISSAAGSKEIFDKDSCFVFNINSFKDFVLTIKKVCSIYYNDYDLYLKYCKNAHSISKNYTWKKFAESIINSDKF